MPRIARTATCAVLACTVAACGSRSEVTPPSAVPVATTKPSAPPPPVDPRVLGAWKGGLVTGAPVAAAGLVATSTGPVAYVGGALSGRLEVGRLHGEQWTFTRVAQDAVLFQGSIAARADKVVLTAITLDLDAFTNDVLSFDAALKLQPVLQGCKVVAGLHVLALDSHGRPIVAAACNGRVVVRRREGATWTTSASWDGEPMLYQAAVDARDRLHLHTTGKGTDEHVLVDGSAHRTIALPEHAELLTLAECGGVIHATFRERGDAPRLAYGTLVGDAWQLETIEKGELASFRLGFDEECRPFAANDAFVWSRGKKAWVRSSPVSAGAVIRALVGNAGTLYAMYEEVHDGVSVGIASAPELPDDGAASPSPPVSTAQTAAPAPTASPSLAPISASGSKLVAHASIGGKKLTLECHEFGTRFVDPSTAILWSTGRAMVSCAAEGFTLTIEMPTAGKAAGSRVQIAATSPLCGVSSLDGGTGRVVVTHWTPKRRQLGASFELQWKKGCGAGPGTVSGAFDVTLEKGAT